MPAGNGMLAGKKKPSGSCTSAGRITSSGGVKPSGKRGRFSLSRTTGAKTEPSGKLMEPSSLKTKVGTAPASGTPGVLSGSRNGTKRWPPAMMEPSSST